MQLSRFQAVALGLSGLTALAIGAFILIAPHVFYASYGITLGQNPALISELRAPGAGLAAFGGLMLLGLVRPQTAPAAVTIALIIFIAFPFGRVVSLIADGAPGESILGALAIELVIAALLIVAFRGRRSDSPRKEDPATAAG